MIWHSYFCDLTFIFKFFPMRPCWLEQIHRLAIYIEKQFNYRLITSQRLCQRFVILYQGRVLCLIAITCQLLFFIFPNSIVYSFYANISLPRFLNHSSFRNPGGLFVNKDLMSCIRIVCNNRAKFNSDPLTLARPDSSFWALVGGWLNQNERKHWNL